MEKDIQYILEKYSRNACSEEELRYLESWLHSMSADNPGIIADDTRIQHMLEQITASPRYRANKPAPVVKHTAFQRIAFISSIAALLLLAFGLSFYYLPQQQPHHPALTSVDIAAGEDKAVLTLADGQQIYLDEHVHGTVAQENGISIRKNADNILTYTLESHPQAGTSGYHTIKTPRGGQYQLILSDGTLVWLNAESSLTFPSRFATDKREVQVSGEAYFSVVSQADPQSANKRVPFIVDTDKQRIEVLGTEFNINTYPERASQHTTLIEGSVRVSAQANGKEGILKPGEQAIVGASIDIVQADLEKEIAWKQGDFIFKHDRLSDILQQVSRWYDISVNYPTHLADRRYSGMVSRQQPLSSIIAMLQSTGSIHLNVKERRLTIE